MTVSILGFACLLFLILLRLPIAFAMGFVGFFGFLILNDYNWIAAISMASRRVINTSQDYGLSVIPLFILMGNLVTRAGLSQELYKASYSFLGHLRGGLSMATVVVSNDLPVLFPVVDRVLMICGGEILYDGSVVDIEKCRITVFFDQDIFYGVQPGGVHFF